MRRTLNQTIDHSPPVIPPAGEAALHVCVALSDFPKEHKGDLAFTIGDEIVVTDNAGGASDAWYHGYRVADANKTVGTFPGNFVELRPSEATPPAPAEHASALAPATNHVEVAVNATSPAIPTAQDIFVALSVFEAQEQGDLGFTAGDEIVVTDNAGGASDAWYHGYRVADANKTVGTFPGNFVELEPVPSEVPNQKMQELDLLRQRLDQATQGASMLARSQRTPLQKVQRVGTATNVASYWSTTPQARQASMMNRSTNLTMPIAAVIDNWAADAFRLFDTNGDSKLDQRELAAMLDAVGYAVEDSYVAKAVEMFG